MNRFVAEFKPEATDVALCGSMKHISLWEKVIDELRASGLTVSTPALTEESIDWANLPEEEVVERKGRFVRRHFANIALAKSVLVCNYEKNGIANYVGTNSHMEMTAGFVYEKPLFLLNPVPFQDSREEVLALEPTVLNGDLSLLTERAKE